jgi:putative SOS response-associated peptidase YedK
MFSFLTAEPNDVARPIHAKAISVMLTTPAEFDVWLSADTEEASKLQRPLPTEQLSVVAKRDKIGAAWRADELSDEGDVDDCLAWRRILEAIDELTRGRRKGEVVN